MAPNPTLPLVTSLHYAAAQALQYSMSSPPRSKSRETRLALSILADLRVYDLTMPVYAEPRLAVTRSCGSALTAWAATSSDAAHRAGGSRKMRLTLFEVAHFCPPPRVGVAPTSRCFTPIFFEIVHIRFGTVCVRPYL